MQRAAAPERPFWGARVFAALALSTAAGLHLAQALRHLPEASSHARLHAAFFLAAGLFQVLSVLGLGGRCPHLVIAFGNLGLAAVWGIAVTLGLPAWLSPASTEAVTVAGTAAAALEVLAASALLVAPVRSAIEHSQVRAAGPGVAVACLALATAGVALPVSGDGHDHSDDHHGAAHPHALHVHGVHLHGLGGDAFDPGPDPRRQARGELVGTRLRVGLRPAAIAVGAGVVWVADREAGVVRRLDERSGRPLGTPTPVGVHPGGVALGFGAVWVTNAGSGTVTKLDPSTGGDLGTVRVGRVPVGVATGAGSVWVTNSAEGTVSRIDPATGEVVTTPRIGYGPTAITVAEGRPWVVNALDRAVVSLDAGTGDVLTETPVGAGPAAIAAGHGSVWVASSSAGTVTRIDPMTGAGIGTPIVVDRRVQPGQGPAALTVGDRVSVLNNHDQTVVTIDPSTHAVSDLRFLHRQVARHITPASLARADGGELWATVYEQGLVVRLPA